MTNTASFHLGLLAFFDQIPTIGVDSIFNIVDPFFPEPVYFDLIFTLLRS